MAGMTFDLLVAGRTDLEPTNVVLAVDAASLGEQLTLQPDRDRRVLAVVDGQDVVRCWIGPTRQVADPAHAASRFGLNGLTDSATYWTELVVPENCDPDLGRRIGDALAKDSGGEVVELFAPTDPVIELPASQSGIERGPFDVTGREAVIVVRRNVVTLGPWLTHGLLYAAADGRRLVILTPPETAISPVVERLVVLGTVRWLVDDGQVTVEPHRGVALTWDGQGFVDDPQAKPSGWREPADSAWVFTVDAETLYSYDRVETGSLTEAVAAAFERGTPSAAGLMEPPEGRWDRAVITEYARQMSDKESSLAVEGADWHGALTIVPQPGGVLERTELMLDAGPAPLDLEGLFALGSRIAATGAQLAIVGYRWTTARRVITPAGVNPALPAVIVAQPERFAGAEEAIRQIAGDRLRVVAGRWVMAFDSPVGITRDQSRALLGQWSGVLAQLRAHDEIELAVQRQQG